MKKLSLLILFFILCLFKINVHAQKGEDTETAPKIRFYIGGGFSLLNNYKVGNLEKFWQTINNDPMEKIENKSTGFFVIRAGELSFAGTNSEHAIGAEAQLILTNSHAIWGSEIYFGGKNEAYFGATFFNIVLMYGYNPWPEKGLFFMIEPGLDLGMMNGRILFANNLYEQSFSVGLGGHIAFGANYFVSDQIGLTFRIGNRFIKINETHQNTSSSTGYSSFYANGTGGETVKVDWSGSYATIGFTFSF